MVAALHLQETLTTKDGLADNYVNVIFEDSKGNLWFGTTHGVSRYDGVTFQNFTTEDGLAANSVEAIFEDSQGNLWFGMSGWWGPVHGGGVSCYDGKTLKTFRTKDGLACDNDEVVDIFEDRDGNLWFATFGGGVSRYDGHIFFNIKKGLVKDISWMGRGSIDLKFQKDFERGKLSEELQKVLKEHSIPSDGQHIVSITKEEDGWLLTDSWRHIYTVKKVDGELKIYNHTEEGMQGMVYAIAQDTSGNLWFGCSGGITCYDGRTLRNFTAKDGLVSGDIGDLLFDKQGNLWIARGDGEGGGLSRYDGVTFTNFPNSEGLPGNIVHSITQGRKGKLWFGTNDGVSVYDGETFHSHDIKVRFCCALTLTLSFKRI